MSTEKTAPVFKVGDRVTYQVCENGEPRWNHDNENEAESYEYVIGEVVQIDQFAVCTKHKGLPSVYRKWPWPTEKSYLYELDQWDRPGFLAHVAEESKVVEKTEEKLYTAQEIHDWIKGVVKHARFSVCSTKPGEYILGRATEEFPLPPKRFKVGDKVRFEIFTHERSGTLQPIQNFGTCEAETGVFGFGQVADVDPLWNSFEVVYNNGWEEDRWAFGCAHADKPGFPTLYVPAPVEGE